MSISKITYILCIVSTFLVMGCADIDPFSPELDQPINNEGEIENLQNNQNGFMLELGRIRQEQQIQAEKINNLQQGLINISKSNTNTGTQILQGDGAMLLVFAAIAAICVSFVATMHFKEESKKNKYLATVFAKYLSDEQTNHVLSQCVNTKIEKEALQTVIKAQSMK